MVVVQDRKQIHFRSAKWLIIFALPGIPLGLMLLAWGNEAWTKGILGLLIILYSVYALIHQSGFRLEKDNHYWLFFCGFFSGILGGAYGVNGPPLVIYGNLRNWSARHFRATLQAYFLPASIAGMIGYAVMGLWNADVTRYFLMCIPAIIPGVLLGRYFNHQLQEGAFSKFIYAGLIAIGLVLLFQSLV